MLLTMIVVSKQKPPGETNLLKLLRRWHGLTQCAARLQPAERNGSNAFCGSTIPKKSGTVARQGVAVAVGEGVAVGVGVGVGVTVGIGVGVGAEDPGTT